MAKKRKKDISFGGWLAAVGCFVRTVQLIGSFFGAGFVSNRWLYMSMLCLLCGGFAVMAYEKKGKASLAAVAAAAACLLSTVMSNMSDGGDALRVASAIFLVLTFALAGLVSVFASDGKSIKIVGGIALVILALFCGAFAFFVTAAPWVTLLTLIAAYVIMGAMMIL